jgi:hypothetical protein
MQYNILLLPIGPEVQIEMDVGPFIFLTDCSALAVPESEPSVARARPSAKRKRSRSIIIAEREEAYSRLERLQVKRLEIRRRSVALEAAFL